MPRPGNIQGSSGIERQLTGAIAPCDLPLAPLCSKVIAAKKRAEQVLVHLPGSDRANLVTGDQHG